MTTMIRLQYLAVVYVIMLTSPTFLVVVTADLHADQERSSTFLDAPSARVRNKRYAFAIPWALRGIAAAPALYRWLVHFFGAAAVTGAAITVREGGREKVRRCYGRMLRRYQHQHNCKDRGGQCCSDDPAGVVRPRRLYDSATSPYCGSAGSQGYCWTNGPGNKYPWQ